MTFFLVVLIVALLLLLGFTIIYFNRKISKFSDDLCGTLDQMIAGADVTFPYVDESIDGKVNIKLKRLYEIVDDRTTQSHADKEKVQALISDIAHQIKTPAANLKMYSQILSQRELTASERTEFLALLETQADKIDFLLRSLVKISFFENGMIKFKPQKIQVHEIISSGLLQIMQPAENKNLNITVSCADDTYAFCDKKWTSEAVFNIIDNAVKYTPQNGNIEITVTEQEFYTLISIKDDGPGIAEKEQAMVFRRFYRSADNENEDGAGIGLFLARELIAAQDGYVQIKSKENKGATFLIFILK